MANDLKPCPCGKTPSELHISEASTLKYAYAGGNCCNEWLIEFRTDWHIPDSVESMENAIKMWNSTARASQPELEQK